MAVFYNIKLMLFNNGTAFAFDIKTQEGHELVIEWDGYAHVFHRYLYMVNDRFHRSTHQAYATQPRKANPV